ncbi:MAG: PolC-type DNA polymerase III [bacterium]
MERAAFWDHDALAITDHGVAHSFPEAAHAAEEYGVKMIFGVEGYIVEDDRPMVLNRTDEFPDNPDRLLPDRCVLIDGETTGVSPINNDLFQVGVLALEDGEIVDEYSSLLPVEEIPREILERSPVEREDILSAPDPDQVKKDLQEFVGDRPVVMYEADFLRHFLREFGIEFSQPVIHLRRIVEAVWKPENPGLDTLVQTQLNSKVKHSYDAARDVRRVKDILEELHDHFQGNERSARCNRAYQVEIPDGLSIALIDDLDREPDPKAPHNHIILLARNDTGMKNLYELISKSHIENFYRQPRMKRSEIQDHREGLIVGSACEAGEIFQSVLRGESDEEIKERMKFYDLVEVQPVENNTFMLDKDGEFENITTREDIQQLTKKIHDLGREMEKLVVGTGDVHFLDPKHDIYRSVLQNAQDFSDADSQAPLYYRTTREMLGCFGYLGDDRAREVVVENPRRVAEMCEEIDPIPDGFHPPEIKGAEEQFTGTIHERARELYGESLPDVVEERLKKEEDSILENQFANLYVMAGKLVDKSLDDGYLVGSRGSVGSSFTAFLMGITEVNPLAAHYRCESCDWVQFPDDTDADVGVDLPSKECPECGELLDRDGYNIPFEVFCGFEGDKIPDIDLNFSGEYQQEVFEYVERLFGSENVFRAGTISTLATKMSWNFVQEYLEERNLHKRSAEQDRLTAGVEGVRKTTGQHPGGMIIVPEDKDITDFTPVNYPANDDEAPFKTTHFDYHAMEEQLVKLDILGHDDPTQLRHLQDLTGVDPVGIPLDDEQTMKLFSDVSVLGIDEEERGMKTGVLAVPEFGTTFVRDMVEQTRPSSFADLLRISGLSHGTDVWLGNAKTLIESNRASLESVISARDDIMNRLIEAGLPEKMAFQIMEDVRKGRGLNEDQIKSMRANDVPKWYIQSCQKIKYLFPKAHAAAYVIMAFRIAYFKVHHPTAFYASYFSLKANHMDARYVTSLDDVEQRLQFLQDIIQDRERDHTARDKSERTVMEVLREAYLRGISVRPPRPAESEPRRFTVEDENVLRAPYVTVESLGGTVADSIRQAYDQSPFSSIEDAENRTGINSSVMENARECGFFEDLPETENLDMFEPV